MKAVYLALLITILFGCSAAENKKDVSLKDEVLIDQYENNKATFQSLPEIALKCDGFSMTSKNNNVDDNCKKVADEFDFFAMLYDEDHDSAIFMSSHISKEELLAHVNSADSEELSDNIKSSISSQLKEDFFKVIISIFAFFRGPNPEDLLKDTKGYIYSKTEIEPLYSNLDSRHEISGPDNMTYRKIDDNWYIFRLQ